MDKAIKENSKLKSILTAILKAIEKKGGEKQKFATIFNDARCETEGFMENRDFIRCLDRKLKMNAVYLDEEYIHLLRDKNQKINLQKLTTMFEIILGIKEEADDFGKYKLGEGAAEKKSILTKNAFFGELMR